MSTVTPLFSGDGTAESDRLAISVLIGNPSPGGRTSRTARAIADKVAGAVGDAEIIEIELAHIASRLFDLDAEVVVEHTEKVASSDLVVVASPTYKASFTGLLKAFLDRYGNNGLGGVVTIPVMLGALPIHYLAPETQLRPVLVELGAVVPTRSFFLVDKEIDLLDERIDAWWSTAREPLLRSLGQVLGDDSLAQAPT